MSPAAYPSRPTASFAGSSSSSFKKLELKQTPQQTRAAIPKSADQFDNSDDRLYFVEQLESLLRQKLTNMRLSLVPYGSAVYGVTTAKSDVDATILVHKAEEDSCYHGGERGMTVLKIAQRVLKESGMNVQLIPSKEHPILRVQKDSDEVRFHVDISANGYEVVHKSNQVAIALKEHEHGIALATKLKQWTLTRKVNGAKNEMLSSYAWMLLVIQFLQDKRSTVEATWKELLKFLKTRLSKKPLKIPDKFSYDVPKDCAEHVTLAKCQEMLKQITVEMAKP